MAAIRTTGLSKRYGTQRALDRLDLTVEEGEIFGFLGPNGAGKSTTINILLDLTKPDDGHAEVLGFDCQREGVEARARTGVLPEGYSVYERLTGYKHVKLAADAKDADDDPLDLLDRVGILDAADRNAGGYSKGMKQRLVLAMALVGEPDLLVLDEPTTGLDPNGAREIRRIIREENERGASIFFSSHILEQVEAVCDRVAILHGGQTVAIDTIEALQEAVGGGTKLLIEATGLTERVLETIEALDGVDTVWVEADETLVVTCRNDAKTDVIVALDGAGAEVENFTTDEPSLEELFANFTGGDR